MLTSGALPDMLPPLAYTWATVFRWEMDFSGGVCPAQSSCSKC